MAFGKATFVKKLQVWFISYSPNEKKKITRICGLKFDYLENDGTLVRGKKNLGFEHSGKKIVM
jgi:hypothetical protein